MAVELTDEQKEYMDKVGRGLAAEGSGCTFIVTCSSSALLPPHLPPTLLASMLLGGTHGRVGREVWWERGSWAVSEKCTLPPVMRLPVPPRTSHTPPPQFNAEKAERAGTAPEGEGKEGRTSVFHGKAETDYQGERHCRHDLFETHPNMICLKPTKQSCGQLCCPACS